MAEERRYPVRVEGQVWIAMDDGVRLGATLYVPDAPADGPFPALLESIPYRKDDWTLSRDRGLHAHFASRGYVSVRLDVRGTGSSQGIALDEYTEREIQDNLQALRWLASQPWSSGALGMFGISWGGFSALQAALRRPPELRAIVAAHFSHDRYTTDVHYYGGTLHVGESIYWPVEMVAQNALPPDPERFGPGWRAEWLRRLRETPQWPLAWLRHQRRDAYWRHGSACADWASLTTPVLAIGGLHDAYRDAVLAVLEHAPAPRRGILGPWGHSWPHAAWPGPSIDGLGEMDRWWDRWLREERNGADEEPMLAVYVQDPLPREAFPARIAGRWWFAERWPLDAGAAATFELSAGGGLAAADPNAPDPSPARAGVDRWRGPLTVGSAAPYWCASAPPQGVPVDQHEDDAASLAYTTAPLAAALVIVGRPRAVLWLSADEPMAQAGLRLCEVAPDGTSALIARGALNLTHRDGHDEPTPLEPGLPFEVRIRLSTAAAVVPAGHRLRLSVAGADWPLAWPSPRRFELSVHHGPPQPGRLELPLAKGMVPDDARFGPPAAEPDPTGLPTTEELPVPEPVGSVVRDAKGVVTIVNDAWEALRFPERGGLRYSSEAQYRLRQDPDDPLSCAAMGGVTYRLDFPGGPAVVAAGRLSLRADATTLHVTIALDVDEDGTRLHEGRWEEAIPRDLL
ncbi:MAG: CocE/NonD family hydrolase [Candidatus Limnocylindrales bacterium]